MLYIKTDVSALGQPITPTGILNIYQTGDEYSSSLYIGEESGITNLYTVEDELLGTI